MKNELTAAASETKTGDSIAKFILEVLSHHANADGLGSMSICLLAEYAELCVNTVKCSIQIFEEIGLLESVEWCDPVAGDPLTVVFQFSLEKLGTDLSEEFIAALSRDYRRRCLERGRCVSWETQANAYPATNMVVYDLF